MENRIIFATGNEHKMVEIRAILADLGMRIESMREAGIDIEVVEDGTTFEENAIKKATGIAKYAKDAIVLADDSGLEIDYLNKEPGIYSARYAGVDTSYDIKNQMLLDRLDGVPDEKRTARFVCAIAAAFPDGSVEVVRGTMEGIIGHEISGENGFGYDPIFFLPEYGCTSAELTPEKKNELSHRGAGLCAMKKIMAEKMN
ncbi:MAG: RdgB/HAM1 family non-canonical purine NTP pyrophosphatase [Hespellia sp.]|nr:RdgB/HAM1 family non-canonical purine NTP pyrophosphatase [Hespellia sp.]